MTLVMPSRRMLIAAVAIAVFPACAGRQAPVAAAPSSPEATLEQFLAAVNANDQPRMATLWGTQRGPSTVWSPNTPDVRQRQIAIMQRLLVSDSHRVTGADLLPGPPPVRRLQVEMVRGDRRMTVPF